MKAHPEEKTIVKEKRAEHLVSGDQIVQANWQLDRVHGVDHERDPDAVYVTTDSKPDVRYDRGTTVPVA